VRYAFIRDNERKYPVNVQCRVFGVSVSGYYGWRDRPESVRAIANRRLLEEIRDIHTGRRRCYGSPRVHEELVGRGMDCSLNRVARVMRENGIVSISKRKFKHTTDSGHDYPIAPNLLNRNFDALRPNEVWVSDITYIYTEEGWLYLATVMDLCLRRVVGWAMDERMTRGLVIDALDMAVKNRRPGSGVLHHSDRGSQYASDDYQERLKKYKMVCSMSRKGDCWDNAVMESFYRSLKVECVYLTRYKTREEARRDIFTYIELFYNRVRRHSYLGYMSPEEYERMLLAA
jgi:transposase InsO family protein